MGQRRQSQSNDEKNTGRKRDGKQQRGSKEKAPPSTRRPQQQSQGAGGDQQVSSDGTAPRAGSGRDADNPSLSANQEDHRGEQDTRHANSVESVPGGEVAPGGRGDDRSSQEH